MALRKLRARIRQEMDRRHPAVLVASMGRSGSTVTYLALIEAAQKRGRQDVRTLAWTLADDPLPPAKIIKTHDFPEGLRTRREKTRTIFNIGSALDAALSVYACHVKNGPEWTALHFEHLKSQGTISDVFERDALQFARQVKEWATFDAAPVLCIKYDALWQQQDRIASFTGLPLRLPQRRARSTKDVPPELLEKARRIYDPIDRVIDGLPDAFVSGPHMAPLVADL